MRWTNKAIREAALVKAMRNLRKHSDTSQFVLRSTSWLLMPIILMMAYIVFFVLWQVTEREVLVESAQRIIAAAALETQMAGMTNSIMYLVSGAHEGISPSSLLSLASRASV